eukprot:6449654-Ditylum_brightwellii.AAC.1
MPGYIEQTLLKSQHSAPLQPEHFPHNAAEPIYTHGPQYAPLPDNSPPLNQHHKQRIQQILGTLLFYAQAVDPTMLASINSIAVQQAVSTKQTAATIVKLLNYAATHPDAVVRYNASGMVLQIHSDVSYMSEPKARSCAGGHFFMSEEVKNPATAQEDEVPTNGLVHAVCEIIRNVMASSAEAELGTLFINAKKGEELRTALEEMGH